jgi:hypothetical protein
MNINDELIIRITGDGGISVEECNDGVKSYKAISPNSLLNCVNESLMRGGVSSGLLPKNCLSFRAGDNGSKDVCILHPEDKADITFLNAKYKDFPLPRLVFSFTANIDGRVAGRKLGIIENSGMLKPETKMYRWPFSHVRGTDICLGNNPLPKVESLHTLGSLPYLILAMPNDLDFFSAENNLLKLEMRELLELLKDKSQDYYYEHILVPSSMTLGHFIS